MRVDHSPAQGDIDEGAVPGGRGVEACRMWVDFPFWFLLYFSFSFAYAVVKLARPPRFDLLPVVLAPLAWFAAYPLIRGRRERSGRIGRSGRLRVPRRRAAAAFVVVTIFLFLAPEPSLGRDTIRALFEGTLYVMAAVTAIHCIRWKGRAALIAVFGVGLAYGVLLENTGIATGFFREVGYAIYLPGLPAPPATMVAWSVSFYLAVWTAQRFVPRASWFAKAAIATVFILSVDLPGDVAAALFGWWEWPDAFAVRLFGVPMINFIAWSSAVFPFYAAWFLIEPWREPSSRRLFRFAAALPVVAIVALALALLLTALFLGIDSPEMLLFRRVAG